MEMTPVLRMTLNPEEDEIVLGLEWGVYAAEYRLRPLDAWAILYLLDPDSDRWTDEGRVLMEAVASQHVGCVITGHTTVLELPHGSVWLHADMTERITTRLWELQREYLGHGE